MRRDHRALLERLRSHLRSPTSEPPVSSLAVRGHRIAAVLLPLFVREDRLHLFYTRRSDSLASHQGQVAFPGGKFDPADRHLLTTALREAHEEVGLDPSQVDVLGGLTDTATASSGYRIAPFVGLIGDPAGLKPNPREVAEMFSVPIDVLRDPAFRGRYRWDRGGSHDYPAILYGGQVIWGLTLRITESLLEHLAAATRPAS